jgi:hypothetical protein
MAATGIVKVALFGSMLCAGFGIGVGVSQMSAQTPATDVAYVVAVRGRVFASAQGKPTLLDALDLVGDRTQLDLQANSELQICHYIAHKLLTLRGPSRASVSASDVTVKSGAVIKDPSESCVAPLMPYIQGGSLSRTPGDAAIGVPLQASIRVINRGTQTIRRIALWNSLRQALLMNFNGNAARPIFQDGESYLLAVERSDGTELKLLLRASAGTQNAPLIVVVR